MAITNYCTAFNQCLLPTDKENRKQFITQAIQSDICTHVVVT